MNRTEDDLRAALRELERRADQHGAPATDDLVPEPASRRPGDGPRHSRPGSVRWLPPLAAAAVVAAAAITAAVLSSGGSGDTAAPAGGSPSSTPTHHAVPGPTSQATHHAKRRHAHHQSQPPAATASGLLDDAAAKLDAAGHWSPPDPGDYFYVRTNQATTWTSVSGTRPGHGHNDAGVPTTIAACVGGQLVGGESGPCTLADVSHYLGDAPTTPSDWDAYLEHLAPGAKAAGAQGKIIVQVLHEDLVAPDATAALLRYTGTSCPGLHTLDVRPVAGEQLVGVTCTSMTAGSYALVLDADSHAFVGFTVVDQQGRQEGQAEIVEKTGIVSAVGRRP